MANSLVEYGYLATDIMVKGIVKTIMNESPFLARLPFREIAGNALLYNLESTEAGTGWYAVGDTWVESTTVWAQRSTALAILGGDADVDAFAKQTRSNEQDVKAAVIELKAKAVADEFEKRAIQGYTTTLYTTKQMKGLMHLLAECESATTTDWDGAVYSVGGGNNSQIISANGTSLALSIDMMDFLRDLVKPKPDCFIMSRRMRNKLQSLARATGNNLTYIADPRQAGHLVTMWGEQEVIISDFILDNIQDCLSSVVTIRDTNPATTRASGYDNSVIFALRWGENDGVSGVTNGWIQTEDIGKLETKDAERTRIKFYCGMANFGKVSLAGLIGVLDTALA